jgi:4-hydroxy-3-polyprenylbenzoate decarboxylase
MPEFPGYLAAQPASILGSQPSPPPQPDSADDRGAGREHVNLTGIPTEASILRMVENAMRGMRNVRHSAGVEIPGDPQFRKLGPADEGRQRQAALTASPRFPSSST